MKVCVEVYEDKYPVIVKQALKKIADELKYHIDKINVIFCEEMLTIKLNELAIECDYFNAWARMKAYYGFEVQYRKDVGFSIGGYESECIQAPTLLSLLKKINVPHKE